MNKSALAREISQCLGHRMTRQMLDKYRLRGMPITTADAAIEWLATSSVGRPYKRAIEILKARNADAATSPPSGATPQPDDDCGATEPPPFLTPEQGAAFYVEELAAVDIVILSQSLQAHVPRHAHCSPQMAEAVRRAIRTVICDWTGGEACSHCRRLAGIVDPPEPDDEPEDRAA